MTWAKLRRVIVDLIDAENWSALGADVKGDAGEGLLECAIWCATSGLQKPGSRPALGCASGAFG